MFKKCRLIIFAHFKSLNRTPHALRMRSAVGFLWILFLIIMASLNTISTINNCKSLFNGQSCLTCAEDWDEIKRGQKASDREAFNAQQWTKYMKLGSLKANQRCESKRCIPSKSEGIQIFACIGTTSHCENIRNGQSCLNCDYVSDEFTFGKGANDRETFNKFQRTRYKELGEKKANERCQNYNCTSVIREGVQLYVCGDNKPPLPLWLLLFLILLPLITFIIVVGIFVYRCLIRRAHNRQQRQRLAENQPLMPGPPGAGQAMTMPLAPEPQAYPYPSGIVNGNPSGSYAYPPIKSNMVAPQQQQQEQPFQPTPASLIPPPAPVYSGYTDPGL